MSSEDLKRDSVKKWETFLLDCGVRDEPENFVLSLAEKFWAEGLDQNLLYSLNDNDLKELGISRMGDRKKILLKIEALIVKKKEETEGATSNDITSTLNFTVLPTTNNFSLSVDNLSLRRKLYIGFANAPDQRKMFKILTMQLDNFFKTHYLVLHGNTLPGEDILYHLLKNTFIIDEAVPRDSNTISLGGVMCHDYSVSRPVQVSESILNEYKRSYCSSKFKSIGFCHLHLNNMIDSSNSSIEEEAGESPANLVGGKRRKKKEFKTCQIQRNVDCDGLLQLHENNATYVGGVTSVDILIFCESREMCHNIASHFGFIYLDEIPENSSEFRKWIDINERRGEISRRLANKNAKLYREIQAYFNQKIMFGLNNVCFTSYTHLFETAVASFKACIQDNPNSDLCVSISSFSSMIINVNKYCLLEFITAITEIINSSLNCDAEFNALYLKEENSEDKPVKTFYNVKFPLAAVIPLYILRYVIQLIKESPNNRIKMSNIHQLEY